MSHLQSSGDAGFGRNRQSSKGEPYRRPLLLSVKKGIASIWRARYGMACPAAVIDHIATSLSADLESDGRPFIRRVIEQLNFHGRAAKTFPIQEYRPSTQMMEFIKTLTPLETRITHLYLIEGSTFDLIAEKIGQPVAVVRDAYREILRRLPSVPSDSPQA